VPRFSALAIFLFIVAPLLALAGESDAHERGDLASPLYEQSVFAHGYIHGYEAGFHLADDDYQMGRPARDLREVDAFKQADGGYRSQFGSKDDFKQGFREGFVAGYEDSFHNRPFRAVSAARLAAEGMQPDAHPDKDFDAGFIDGYHAAAVSGTAQSCISQKGRPESQVTLQYCDGFGRGYQFGLQAPSIDNQQQSARSTVGK
jgi:hypothetical protein